MKRVTGVLSFWQKYRSTCVPYRLHSLLTRCNNPDSPFFSLTLEAGEADPPQVDSKACLLAFPPKIPCSPKPAMTLFVREYLRGYFQ